MPDLSGWLGRDGNVVTSPARRCRVSGAAVDALLGPWDLGRWAGLALSDVPDLPIWRADPSYDDHGGESLLALLDRTKALLGQWRDSDGRLAAITHGAVVRAVLTTVLGAPPQAFWDIDIAPGGATELHGSRVARWRVIHVNSAPG